MSGITIGGETFDSHTDKVEATSLSRPDTSWCYVDRAGHEHRWYRDGKPAEAYDPLHGYDLPTLDAVEDEPEYYDGEEIRRFHYECAMCRERIAPRRCADTHRVYVRGVTFYSINGESVGAEEFKARAEAAIRRAGIS